MALPNTTTGACPAGTVPVYRLWNQRFDSNHRFTTDPVVKAQMVARGYVAEGYGPDAVSMCASSVGQPDPQFPVSAASPFAPGCDGVAATGTLFENAEVEPMVAVDPTNPANLIGVWQQDRWSNGGSRGLLTGLFVRWRPHVGAHRGASFALRRRQRRQRRRLRARQRPVGHLRARRHRLPDLAVVQWRREPAGLVQRDPRQPLHRPRQDVERSGHADPRRAGGLQRQGVDHRRPDRRAVRLRDVGSTGRQSRPDLVCAHDGRRRDVGTRAGDLRSRAPTSQTLNNQIVVLPDGTLVDFFTLFDPDPALADHPLHRQGRHVVRAHRHRAGAGARRARSRERGTDVRDSADAGLHRGQPRRACWSRRGRIRAFPAGVRDGIALSRSTDGGLTWSAPVRVNRDPSVQAFSPTVTVRDDGTIGVTYYDFRNNTTDPTDAADRSLARAVRPMA